MKTNQSSVLPLTFIMPLVFLWMQAFKYFFLAAIGLPLLMTRLSAGKPNSPVPDNRAISPYLKRKGEKYFSRHFFFRGGLGLKKRPCSGIKQCISEKGDGLLKKIFSSYPLIRPAV